VSSSLGNSKSSSTDFASCEQSLHPEYKGRPVITGKERGIVAAASYIGPWPGRTDAPSGAPAAPPGPMGKTETREKHLEALRESLPS